jgi:hypothetical protein
MKPDKNTARLRKIVAAFPEAEMIPHGEHAAFKVRGKNYAWHTVDEHGDGRVALVVKMVRGENELLVASDPTRYFLPRYVANHGYVGVYLDLGTIDWDEVDELAEDAYLLTAPKTLARRLEAERGAGG